MKNGIYTGKSPDGSDMKRAEGVYASPNKLFWGSNPISLNEERRLNRYLFLHKKPTR